MSLVVWLPLNGNLENQGLFQLPASPSTSSISYTDGKIGRAASGYCIYHLSSEIVQNKWSLACWCYSSAWGQYNDILLCNNTKDSNDCRFYFSIIGGSSLNIGINGPSSTASFGFQFSTNTWYHVAATYDGTNYALYINGTKVKSGQCTTAMVSNKLNLGIGGRSMNENGTSATGMSTRLNDVRIYDHTLSAKEVKELSKGLVLHYRLAGPGQSNLITAMEAGGRTTLVDKYTLNADFGQNADTYGYINVNPALELDKTYTLSFDVLNMPAGSRWGWRLWNNPNYDFLVNGNGHYSYTFSPSVSKLPNGYNLNRFLFDDTGKTNPAGIITFTNFKIEEGSIATPWCPHKDDALYSAMGYNNNIEYDCAGYQRNGTKNGNITWNVDSPRYTTSYSTKNGTAYLISPNIFNSSIHNFTLSIWGKTSNQGGRMIFSSGPATSDPALYHSGNLVWCVGDGDRSYFENNGVAIQARDYKDGKWHHYAVTGDGIENKLYIDGQYAGKSHIYHPLGYTYTLGKWIGDTSHNWDGLMSDFRIYATTLSADDIAELYHSAVIVDNTGKSYAYEYFEAR